MTVQFEAADGVATIAKAIGAHASHTPTICVFNVGDFISFPEAPALLFRVAKRRLAVRSAPEPSIWFVTLEQAP